MTAPVLPSADHTCFVGNAVYAAELAGLGAYARAVLVRANDDEPTVVSLRVSVALAGGSVVNIEFCELSGFAVGGAAL